MMKQTRRGFLGSLGAAGTGLVAATVPCEGASHKPNDAELGMLYDATLCVGCKACMAACKRTNSSLGALEFEKADFDQDKLWDAPRDLSGNTRTIIKLGRMDGGSWSYVKHACMHCQKPACVSACPVRAMVKDPETGAVEYRKDVCIGCRYCQIACPFNIPKFQWDRTIPQIVKCDLCRSTNLKTKGISACAEVCPTGALIFGKRADLLKQAKARIQESPKKYVPHIYGEHEIGGTNVMLLAGMPFTALGLPKLGAGSPAEFSEKIQHTIYKGMIAPIALFATLWYVAVRNQKKAEASHAAPSEER
ncbi:MAG: hydrogenase 2 operon protein HybA [Verrucomicrobiia bacterium]